MKLYRTAESTHQLSVMVGGRRGRARSAVTIEEDHGPGDEASVLHVQPPSSRVGRRRAAVSSAASLDQGADFRQGPESQASGSCRGRPSGAPGQGSQADFADALKEASDAIYRRLRGHISFLENFIF